MTDPNTEPPSSGPIRVLYVGSDPETAAATARALEREADGIDATAAAGVAGGLDALAGACVDCVVSDHAPPGVDGLALLAAVREDRPDLPFVLYPDDGSEAVAAEAIAAGVTGYVPRGEGEAPVAALAARVRSSVAEVLGDGQRTESAAADAANGHRLRELAEATDDVLWMFSGDMSEVLFVNSAYEDIWGRPVETLREDPEDFLEGVHPDDRDLARRAMDRISAGEPIDVEFRVDGRSGFGRRVWVKGEPIVEDGEVVRTVGFAREVTGTREREEELRTRTRAMDAAPIGTTISDVTREGDPIVYANERFEELTGYDEGEILGRNCSFLQGEDTDPDRAERLAAAVESGERVSVELRNYRKDGTEFWNRVSVAPVEDDDGEVTHYVGFQQDVTEHRERQRELREERAFIEQSLDALDDVFYVFDENMEILRWNDQLRAVTGYTDEEISGMTPTDFFPADHRDRVAEGVEEVLETGSARVQADYQTADGERIPHEFTGLRLTDGEGNVTGFAGIGRNVTDRLEYQRRLERKNERLEQFARIVSHDLRNPLEAVRGSIELAEHSDDSEHLRTARRYVARMESLIDDLLALTRDGSPVDEGNLRTVELPSLVEESWEAVPGGDATLALEVAPGREIRADPGRLRRILVNLLGNAVEHGDPDVVTVGAIEGGFYVEDDGHGIPETERERVFEVGYTSSPDGTGFGLNIVERFAEAHGWEVRATGGDTGGARFEVTGVEVLPRAAR